MQVTRSSVDGPLWQTPQMQESNGIRATEEEEKIELSKLLKDTV